MRAIGEKSELMVEAVRVALDEQGDQTVSFIVAQELHGQVLNQRSGKLAGSIRKIPSSQEGTAIVSHVEGGGGPTGIHGKFYKSYAELFERGVSMDIVPVKAKALRFETIEGEIVFAQKVHLELPRPFMAPALAAREVEIVSAVDTAITDVLRSSSGFYGT